MGYSEKELIEIIKKFCLECLNLERKRTSFYDANYIRIYCDADDCPFYPDKYPFKNPEKAIEMKCNSCVPAHRRRNDPICHRCPIFRISKKI